jgi:hypothetical protein
MACLLMGQASPKSLHQKYDLSFHAKVGEVAHYRIALDLGSGPFAVNFDADVRLKVLQKDRLGQFEIESSTRNMRVTTNDDVQKPPDEPPSVDWIDRFGNRLKGSGESERPFNSLEFAFDLRVPPHSVVVGEKWATEGGLRTEYQFTGVVRRSGISLCRLNCKVSGPPAKKPLQGSGYLYVDPRTGQVQESYMSLENVVIDPDSPATSVTIRAVRQSLGKQGN